MKKTAFFLVVLLLLQITACERFDHDYKTNIPPLDPETAEDYLIGFSTELQQVLAQHSADSTFVERYYNTNYLNNGKTREDMFTYYANLAASVSDSVIVGFTVIADNVNTINFTLFVDDTQNAVHEEMNDTLLRLEASGFSVFGNQQNPSLEKKRILVQLVTGTWCPNCPYAEEALSSLQTEYADELIYVEYQWPLGLINNYFTLNNADLTAYYGISSAPVAIFDGETLTSSGSAQTESEYRVVLNQLLAQEPILTLKEAQAEIGSGQISGSVKIATPADFDYTDLYLCYVLRENYIEPTIAHNTHNDGLHNTALFKGEKALTATDNNVSFNLPYTGTLPADVSLVIFVQKKPATFIDSAPVMNVIEVSMQNKRR